MPIRYRHWYINRLLRHFEERNRSMDASKSNSTPKQDQSSILNKMSLFEQQVKNKLG